MSDVQLRNACSVAAASLGIDTDAFVRRVFQMAQREYELADARLWLVESGYDVAPDDAAIRELANAILDRSWDDSLSDWERYQEAYDRLGLNIPKRKQQ